MFYVDHDRWGQTAADLRRLALSATHARSRQRFPALHEIVQGRCATEVAERTGRRPQTVMDWLHRYNNHGPTALLYQRSGGRPRFARTLPPPSITKCAPRNDKPPLHPWSARLGPANPDRRAAFVKHLHPLLDDAPWDRHHLVCLDEAHVHQDVDLGHGWGVRGQRFYVASASPALADKISFYGRYLYNEAQVRIWPYARASGAHTIDVLRRLRAEIPEGKLLVICDGAAYHRAQSVWSAAASLDIQLVPLPGDSPDLMPLEALWRWLREAVA